MSEGYSGILQIYPHQDSWTWIHTIVLPPYHWKAHQNVSDEKEPHSFLRIPWRRGVPSSSNPTNVRSLPSSRLTIALPQEQVFHQYISPTNLQTSHMKELNRTKSWVLQTQYLANSDLLQTDGDGRVLPCHLQGFLEGFVASKACSLSNP